MHRSHIHIGPFERPDWLSRKFCNLMHAEWHAWRPDRMCNSVYLQDETSLSRVCEQLHISTWLVMLLNNVVKLYKDSVQSTKTVKHADYS